MNKNRIRLNESQLQGLIKKSVKKIINEGGHLTWKDDDGRMHTNSRDTWYGVEGSTFVSHGEWSDGEIYFDYQGEQYVINAYEAEQWLWDDFKDYCQENNLNPDEHTDDEIWENFASSEAYDVLLNLGPYNENYEMNESKKRKIKLTESKLYKVINKTVNKILKEGLDNEAKQELNPKLKKDKNGNLKLDSLKKLNGVFPGGDQRSVHGKFLDYSPEQSNFSSTDDWTMNPDYNKEESAQKVDDCLSKLCSARDYANANGDGKLFNLLNSIIGELNDVSKDLKNGNDL